MARIAKSLDVISKLIRIALKNFTFADYSNGKVAEICCAVSILKCIITKEEFGSIIANFDISISSNPAVSTLVPLYVASLPLMMLNGVVFHWLILVRETRLLAILITTKIAIKLSIISYLFSTINSDSLPISHILAECSFLILMSLFYKNKPIREK